MTTTMPRDIPLDAPGCALVLTRPLRKLLTAAPIAIANRKIIVLDGPEGAGKSCSLEVMAANVESRVVTVKLEDQMSAREVLEAIYAALRGLHHPLPEHERRSELMMHLRTELTDADVILMVDEAQKAPLRALELVRTLHEHRGLQFGLVLAGADMNRKLSREPMLRSRVGLLVPYPRFEQHELVEFLHGMYPPLTQLAVADLVACDELLCRGDLRMWVALVQWIQAAADPDTPLTAVDLEDAMDLVGGREFRLPR